ncbi:hypothetical protein ABLE94_06575 [Gordonia sp. VNK1]|uniref:hypothetical protein n=1 Tax=Gordonia oleivorans TaxID=3156618 RepID=UPI0032B5DC89
MAELERGRAPGSQPDEDDEFFIHCLNNYSNIAISVIISDLGLQSDQVRKMIRQHHDLVVRQLEASSIDYKELGNALVPKPGRHEVAFIFNSRRHERVAYGYEIADLWVPALKQHGPEKTALRVGDVIGPPDEFIWQEFDERLVGPSGWPRLAAGGYFVVYMTNMSATQLTNTAAALLDSGGGYLGYVDCSTWCPFKFGLHLPQVGLRLRDAIICERDVDGYANLIGYPYEASGFQIVGIDEAIYGPFLSHRLDNGVPEWADVDSSVALSLLGGDLQPATTTRVVINESRIQYLNTDHGNSLRTAGLASLDHDALADAIKSKLTNGLVYNMRFKPGSRNGKPAPELNAMMYSVQVEFPDENGEVRRYQVGLKYTADTHTSEIITFY